MSFIDTLLGMYLIWAEYGVGGLQQCICIQSANLPANDNLPQVPCSVAIIRRS